MGGGQRLPPDNAIHDKDVPDSYSTTSEMRLPSADGSGIGHHGSATKEELADRFGVSSSTLDRVSTILDQGTPEQIQSLRDKGETGEGPGVRTVYEQVQSEKLKSKLQRPTEGQAQQQQEVRRDNLKLISKDFRTVTRDEIPDRISRPCVGVGLSRTQDKRG